MQIQTNGKSVSDIFHEYKMCEFFVKNSMQQNNHVATNK